MKFKEPVRMNRRLKIALMSLHCIIDHLLLRRSRSRFPQLATKADLEALQKHIDMKESESNAIIITAAAQSREAFAEISKLLEEQNKQIADLIAAAGDYDVDPAVQAALEELRDHNQKLADIVSGTAPPVDPDAPPLNPPGLDPAVAAMPARNPLTSKTVPTQYNEVPPPPPAVRGAAPAPTPGSASRAHNPTDRKR